MGMIDRYRKKGGFIQLLVLMETTGKEKQDKFMQMIAEENPAWEVEVRKRLLTIDRILGWNANYLAEVFPRVQPLQLAMIAGSLPPEKAQLFMSILNYKERKKVEEILETKTPGPSEYTSGLLKLFAEIRKMSAEGSLKFEKFDQEMVIPENIEEQLGQGRVVVPTKDLPAEPAKVTKPEHTEHSPTLAKASPAQLNEEISFLRKKINNLMAENQQLQKEIETYKAKLVEAKRSA